MIGIDILAVILIAVFLIALGFYAYSLIIAALRGTIGWIAVASTSTIGLLLVIYLSLNIDKIAPAEWAQVFILLGLVGVTGYYALSANKQANASIKMAEEMKEQRVVASRPLIVQKALYYKDIWEGSTRDYLSHFEISKVGRSPAIELEISFMDAEGRKHSIRQTFLRPDDPPIKFRPSNIASLPESKTYYIISEYGSIYPTETQKQWYQTRLPFKTSKSSKEGAIYVVAGELEFLEVSEKERIDAFTSGSKPK